MASKYLIYGLFDPRDGQLRYVGKTEGPLRVRLNHHIHRALKQKTNTYKAAWIRQVLAAGKRPEIEVLEECRAAPELAEAECWHIAFWRFLGCRLTNLTEGGEGASGYRHTLVARRRMSDARVGKRGARAGSGFVPSVEIVQRYQRGEHLGAIAASIGCTGSGLAKALRRSGVRIRNAAKQRWMSLRLRTQR